MRMKIMMCPKCLRKYAKRYVYCPKCAKKLEEEPNRCSNPQSIECKEAIFEKGDIVCGYCGSDTTYMKEFKENLKDN